jgi:hypothetical protein
MRKKERGDDRGAQQRKARREEERRPPKQHWRRQGHKDNRTREVATTLNPRKRLVPQYPKLHPETNQGQTQARQEGGATQRPSQQ